MKRKTSFRLTDDLDTGLDAYLKKHGGDQSQVMRQALRAFLDSTPIPQKVEYLGQRLEKLRQDLARVGANLNQTAHYFNINDDLKPGDLAANHIELKKEFRKISETLNEIQNGLTSKLR